MALQVRISSHLLPSISIVYLISPHWLIVHVYNINIALLVIEVFSHKGK